MALRSGNVYAIESAREEEAVIEYYELLRQSIVRRLLEDKSITWTCSEEPKAEAVNEAKAKKGISPMLKKLKEEPEAPDYRIIEEILVSEK